MKLANNIIDFLFLIDILLIFNTAFYTEDMEIITHRKTIAKKYIRGWFFIDSLAILPFELILGAAGDYNALVRVARFGRLYKLVKLTKLFRIIKVIKDKSKMLRYI